jgi:hypothetical protein
VNSGGVHQTLAQQIQGRTPGSWQHNQTQPGSARQFRVQQTYSRVGRSKHQRTKRIIAGMPEKTFLAERSILGKQPERQHLYRIEPHAPADLCAPESPGSSRRRPRPSLTAAY